MTYREKEVYDAIIENTNENGYPPSIRELCLFCGIKSTSTVHAILRNLAGSGLIEINEKGKYRISGYKFVRSDSD